MRSRRRRGSWHPERIGREVERELAHFGPASAIGEIVAVWPDAVGEAIARNAWPARLARDGTLHVAAASSAWAFELTQLAPVVLERLAAALGERSPGGLRFTVGPMPAPGPQPVETSSRAVPEVTPAQREEAARIALRIEDPQLRDLVARAAAASLAATDRSSADRGV
jgi:hypothetical protein